MGAIFAKAIAAGVMIRTMENNIILSPPLIVTDEHVETILSALDRALAEI
jgi:adenosylmethionine-8-amino-7-oxononanoate aminotransferase